MIDLNYGKIIVHKIDFINNNCKTTTSVNKNKKKENKYDGGVFDKLFQQELEK
ncbi:MAG: hypothetical protein PHD15_00965 [Clostridia bacterium]|nr:hypothetical protein [Clostridia bacterium]MDD4386322.1 hypothetical protein [Clostridia bacterium]